MIWIKRRFSKYMAARTYHVISKEVENIVFRHNRIFRHTCMYKQPILTNSSKGSLSRLKLINHDKSNVGLQIGYLNNFSFFIPLLLFNKCKINLPEQCFKNKQRYFYLFWRYGCQTSFSWWPVVRLRDEQPYIKRICWLNFIW